MVNPNSVPLDDWAAALESGEAQAPGGQSVSLERFPARLRDSIARMEARQAERSGHARKS